MFTKNILFPNRFYSPVELSIPVIKSLKAIAAEVVLIPVFFAILFGVFALTIRAFFSPSYLKTTSNLLLTCFSDDFSNLFCPLSLKVDIVRFPHPLLKSVETTDGIRMYSDADICAMKIQAVLGRGKKKDFWDLRELFHHYSLQQIIDWHKQKYPNQMLAISIPNALTYFNDADESETPVSMKGQTWESIKKDISKTVSDYLR